MGKCEWINITGKREKSSGDNSVFVKEKLQRRKHTLLIFRMNREEINESWRETWWSLKVKLQNESERIEVTRV